MPAQPILTTKRLTLRPFVLSDATDVQRLAGDRAVADGALNLPHPYEDGIAEAWIEALKERFDADDEIVFAVTLTQTRLLLGTVGLIRSKMNPFLAEMGYWIGVPFWNHGYCTEAARRVAAFGFSSWSLHRIHAHHFSRNPSSGRVMEKIGMKKEGLLRRHVFKRGRFENVVVWGMLKHELKGDDD
jgi:[ribosomal protein S5]-alanine N-acetyltransferase